MNFVETFKRRVEKKYKVIYKRGPSTVALFFAGIAFASWAAFLLASGFPIAQYAYYKLRPATTVLLAKALLSTVKTTEAADVAAQLPKPELEDGSLPEKDISLPDGHYLTIPKIGVDTVIWEAPTAEYESALKRGVWRVPEFATPDKIEEGKPTIIVAHRFGYLEWTQEFRKKNSFFDLPKLKPGEEFEVVWEQRRYKYVVKSVEEGNEIKDYKSDLILYTCKFLVSPVRIFVYADRVN